MYRIDTEKLSAFKEATFALRQRIEETKEECTVQTDSISQAWEGDAAEAATQTGQELVTRLTGEAETLCGLEAVLEDALEKSHMLLNQSRKFASILEEGDLGNSKAGEVSVWGRKCFPILQRSLTRSANIHSTSPLSWGPHDGQAPARDKQNDFSY